MPGKIMNPDSKIVGELAAAGCSNSEIADILGCSEKMIGSRRFAAILAKNRAEVRKHLRQVQIEAALGGSVMMMIWLSMESVSKLTPTRRMVNSGSPFSSCTGDVTMFRRFEKL